MGYKLYIHDCFNQCFGGWQSGPAQEYIACPNNLMLLKLMVALHTWRDRQHSSWKGGDFETHHVFYCPWRYSWYHHGTSRPVCNQCQKCANHPKSLVDGNNFYFCCGLFLDEPIRAQNQWTIVGQSRYHSRRPQTSLKLSGTVCPDEWNFPTIINCLVADSPGETQIVQRQFRTGVGQSAPCLHPAHTSIWINIRRCSRRGISPQQWYS